MRYFTKMTLTMGVCGLLLGGCTVRQEDFDALNSRVSAQEQRINVMGGQLSGVQPAQADMWSQVQDLSQDMSFLKGRIDTLENNSAASNDIALLRERLDRHEQALRRIAADFALDLPMLDDQTDQPVDATSEPDPDVAQTPATHGDTAPMPGNSPTTMDTATALYEQGLEFFNNRSYENALVNFKDFTDVYPTHTLAANAWFWQGESNYQMKNYAAAALAYEQVIAKFPRSAKYPSALMKQGICFYSLGRDAVGRGRLEEVIQKFPGTPEAIRAQKFIDEHS